MVGEVKVHTGGERRSGGIAVKRINVVQIRNPRTDRYVKVDRGAGVILSHKKSPGPYKGIRIAEKSVRPWEQKRSMMMGQVMEILWRADRFARAGDFEQARELYEQFMTVTRRLVSQESEQAYYSRHLSEAGIKLGDVLLAEGNLNRAQEAYEAALAIDERLAQLYPSLANLMDIFLHSMSENSG